MAISPTFEVVFATAIARFSEPRRDRVRADASGAIGRRPVPAEAQAVAPANAPEPARSERFGI